MSSLPDLTTSPTWSRTDASDQATARPVATRGWISFLRDQTLATWIFAAGLLAAILPTMMFVARSTWSEEQGAHGPIILATGLWLVWNQWSEVRHLAKPPPVWRPIPLLAVLIPVFLVTRITQIVELEGYAMYAVVVAACYALVGGRVMHALAFPIIYLAFAFPPPETLVYTLTLPIKVAITQSSIAILQALGYPIGGTGVMIQIGQYQLLVAAACAGLNSIISLSALTLFYIHIMHRGNRRTQYLLLLFVVPVAIAANFLRVLILILLTYHAGEAAAQSFIHDLAGITTFILAIGLIFLVDLAISRFSKDSRVDAHLEPSRHE